jgi:4-hydroxybenzoate polyprenyltransferase
VGGLLLSMGFTLWLYSNLLKRLPLVGNLVLPVLPTTVLLSVGALYGFFSLKLLLLIVLAGFITLIRSLTKDMADMRGDKQFGLRTLPILWGIRKTKKLIFAIAAVGGLVATMALWQLKNWPLLLYFSLLLLPIGWFLYRLYYADRKAEYRKLSVLAKYIMLSGLGAVLFL